MRFSARMVYLFSMISFCANFLLPLCAQDKPASKLALPATDDGLAGARTYSPLRVVSETLGQSSRKVRRGRCRQKNAVVFFGDSITEGWQSRPDKEFPGVKIANRGISGDTTRGMLLRLQEDVLSLHPSAVIMLMGTNDLEEQATAADIAGNVKLIVQAMKAHNAKMPIVLCNVMPSSASKKRPADKIQEINKQVFEVVKGDPLITVIDTWTLLAGEGGDAKPEEFPDLLHPNDAGYAKWAAALRPILATLGFMETEPDNFQLEAGYESLFNGKDLTGWGFRPDSKGKGRTATFDGQTASDDGRYVAKNGRLIVTTPPEGRRIQQLWTTREFPTTSRSSLNSARLQRRQRHFHSRSPTAMPRLPAGWSLQTTEELQAPGLE